MTPFFFNFVDFSKFVPFGGNFNSFIKSLIFWHPWNPRGRVHVDFNKNSVQTGCVVVYRCPDKKGSAKQELKKRGLSKKGFTTFLQRRYTTKHFMSQCVTTFNFVCIVWTHSNVTKVMSITSKILLLKSSEHIFFFF